MRRTSYSLKGRYGVFNVEVEQHPDGHIEVAQLDGHGVQLHPIFIMNTWEEARDKAGTLIGEAVTREEV